MQRVYCFTVVVNSLAYSGLYRQVVLVYRWSLLAGGICIQLVSIGRRSLYTVGLYRQVALYTVGLYWQVVLVYRWSL